MWMLNGGESESDNSSEEGHSKDELRKQGEPSIYELSADAALSLIREGHTRRQQAGCDGGPCLCSCLCSSLCICSSVDACLHFFGCLVLFPPQPPPPPR